MLCTSAEPPQPRLASYSFDGQILCFAYLLSFLRFLWNLNTQVNLFGYRFVFQRTRIIGVCRLYTCYVYRPTNEVVRLLLSRANQTVGGGVGSAGVGLSATSDDLLSVTALHYWGCPGRQNAQRFAEILGGLVTATMTGLKAAEPAVEESGAAARDKKRNGVKYDVYFLTRLFELFNYYHSSSTQIYSPYFRPAFSLSSENLSKLSRKPH